MFQITNVDVKCKSLMLYTLNLSASIFIFYFFFYFFSSRIAVPDLGYTYCGRLKVEPLEILENNISNGGNTDILQKIG